VLRKRNALPERDGERKASCTSYMQIVADRQEKIKALKIFKLTSLAVSKFSTQKHEEHFILFAFA
jgi:hypothetical protein